MDELVTVLHEACHDLGVFQKKNHDSPEIRAEWYKGT